MSSLRSTRPPVQSTGLDRLACWLAGEGYPSEAISHILIYTHREGTPTGAPDLDREDEEHAEHAFVEGQEPVAGVSAEWDEHGTEPGRGPVYRSLGADYTLDRLGWSLEQMQAALADTDEMPLPPISGGAPVPIASAEEVRRWYDEQPSFGEWVEAEGGVEWEED
jgi:hypothetical protein